MGYQTELIRVPMATLEENAQRLGTFADESEDLFDRICNLFQNSVDSGRWMGIAAQAAIESTLQNKSVFAEVISDIRQLETFLKEYIAAMEQADEELAQKVRRVPAIGGLYEAAYYGHAGGR